MFDLNRTLKLIKGAIFDPETTWNDYLPDADDWQKTAVLLTGPLVVSAGVLAYVLGLIFPSRIPFYSGPSFGSMLMGIIVGLIAAALIAFVVSFLAGLFKGKASFARGLAATSLAFVPGYAGQALAPLPWIGWLIGLGLFVYGLVLLWRIIPKYLDVPAASRVGHFILSIVATIVTFFLLGAVTGMNAAGPARDIPDFSQDEDSDGPSGMFGEMERQGKLMEEADEDSYDPPSNGKLSKKQVERYISVMKKTSELRQSQTEDLKALSEKADNEDIESIGEVFSGLGRVMQLSTAEMEVVKTGGGNWAEHQWVKEQLRVAMIQKDINEAVEHNYELYQDYEEELREIDR